MEYDVLRGPAPGVGRAGPPLAPRVANYPNLLTATRSPAPALYIFLSFIYSYREMFYIGILYFFYIM